MKKLLSIIAMSFAIVILSGCSAVSNPSTTSSVWKSTDGGKTWVAKNKIGQKANLSSSDVLSMAVNPYDTQNVLVGTDKDGIFYTEDGGENWSPLNFQSQKVYGLAIDATDGRIIYASGVWQNRGKIWRSSDSGLTWREIYTAPAAGPIIISLTLGKNSNVIYATTSDDQVIKSTDAGQTWKNIYQSSSPVLDVAIDSLNDNLAYFILQGGGVLRSRNGGNTMEDISRNIASVAKSQDASIVIADPKVGNVVYVAGSLGIARSTDGGNTWKKLELLSDAQNFPVKAVAISPANPSELVYGAAQTVYKSTDGGATWTTSQFDTSKTVNMLRYNPSNPNIIYMGLSGITK